MATRDSITPSPPINLPPDPYRDEPYSILFVWFKPIPDFPGYGIDTDGNAWSCWIQGTGRYRWADRWHKLASSGGDRASVVLRREGCSYTRRLYRIVLETFVGPCPAGMEACHFDDDQSNNRLSNLRWGTHKSNCEDRSRNNKHPVGSDSVVAKYDELSIGRAKALLAEGIRVGVIAELTGIGRATVFALKRGEGWVHVPVADDAPDLSLAREMQARGMRNNVWLEHDGRRMIVGDWARHLGISSVTIRTRLSRGWPLSRVLCPTNFRSGDSKKGA